MAEKRFKMGDYTNCRYDICEILKDGDYYCTVATEDADLIIDVLEENERLKQYIYDNLDEDICDLCSYQYLEKSQMDKYYVAKCKKGYDDCPKGTVIHCKDFKFRELR